MKKPSADVIYAENKRVINIKESVDKKNAIHVIYCSVAYKSRIEYFKTNV